MGTAMAKGVASQAVQASMGMMMGILESMVPPEKRAEAKADIEKQVNEGIKQAKGMIQKKEDDYKADKDAKDTAAFKVMDVNGDGTIQLSEFVAMFEPESAKK